jgi:HEAT repeat protein/thiol-disulfide isomerase/thioredoxin
MRLPRLRFKLWVLIVAIAAVAVLIVVMMRPHPVGSIFTLVKWSDGSRTITGPAPTRYRTFGPLLGVEWSDGSSRWYLSRNLLRHGILGDSAANWLATLKNDSNAAAREQAASEICDNAENIDPGAAVPVLIAAMKDQSSRVRYHVAWALWRFAMRATSALPALAEATRDEEVLVRMTAVMALGDAPKTDAAREIAVPALVGALKDRRNIVRCLATRKLVGWAEGGKGVSAMIEIQQGQGAPETREDDRISNRQSAIRSLEEIGSEARAAIPVLVGATKDDDGETRVRAAKALVVMGERVVALPVLERAVADQSEKGSVREMATRELAKLKAQGDAESSPQPKDSPSSFPVLSGIGVALSITETGAEIHKVLPGSAAEKSGKLKEGDCIVAIRNGDRTIDVKRKPLGDVVSLIRGPVGTTVTLEVRSGKLGTTSLVTVKREAVPIPALAERRSYDEMIGMRAPTIEFSALDQKSHFTLAKFKGKVVVIDFWASWCGTCFAPVDKMQEIARAHPEYGDRVVLLAASIDTDLRATSKVIEARKWDRTTHVALAPEKLETIKIATVPALMIISPEGKIAAVGDPHAIAIEKEIDKLRRVAGH